jgi:phosphatidylglycerophosphate synthase
MEASVILVYLLLKTTIKPNTVTIIYAAMGVLGGILLAIPSKVTIILAILVFFFKGILDWTDGHLARLTNQTSILGEILDPCGSRIGEVGLWVGLGLYIAHKSGMLVFYYLVPIIPALWAIDVRVAAVKYLFDRYLSKERFQKVINRDRKESSKDPLVTQGKGGVAILKKVYRVMREIFTARARFVDSICLILLIEMFSDVFILWFIFLAFLVWQLVLFLAYLYREYTRGTTVARFGEKLSEISQAINTQSHLSQ